MAIRIYSLSKELKIDSKELVDICTKAGVGGKGSALASLTEEEVARVKAFIANPRGPARPAHPPTHTTPPILPPNPAPKPAPPAPKAEPAPPPEVPAPSPPAAKPPLPPSGAPVAPLASLRPHAPTAPGSAPPLGFSRQDYIAPTGASGGVRIIENRPKRTGEPRKKEGEEGRSAAKQGPVVKLAAIPKGAQALIQTPKSTEPAPQKPIMALPKDAIRTAKQGTRPPLEHLTRTAEKKRTDVGGGKKTGDSGVTPLDSKGVRDRRKGGVRGGVGGDRDMSEMADLTSAREMRQKARKDRKVVITGEEDDDDRLRGHKKLVRRGTNTAAPRKDKIVLELPCTVRSFSEATGVGGGQIQKVLMGMGILATINAVLEPATAEMIATELGLNVELKKPLTLEETVLKGLEEQADLPENLQPRPPVVTFLGHVDHGKTSLLDRIIGTNVVAGEAGGITQHIRAYQIDKDGRRISFVDTPGHEAFTEMRARGAHVTDIVVLVVAADDGVMPQTEEAISHARAANVPIVVALNKIDLPGADPNRVMQQLAAQNVLVTEWGGEVEIVKCSALKGTGINELLETLLLTADIHELKANPDRPGMGTCLESSQQAGRGVAAKIMVRSGTLRVGDIIVCGAAHGRIKAMYDTLRPDKKIEEAGPSTPVDVIGLDLAPAAGDKVFVLNDIVQAREIAALRAQKSREDSLSGRSVKISFDEFQRRLQEGELAATNESVTLNLIVRADVRGSIEALLKELEKLEHPEVKVSLLQASVGGITVADVTLAGASDAVIIGFNVTPDEAARALAEERGVEIRRYDIIYKVTDDIRAMLEGRLKPEERVVELGRALVKQVFTISRVGTVAGCQVMDGAVERNARARVIRDSRVLGDYAVDTLKREKDDAKSVARGLECGIKLTNFNDVKVGDIFEVYKMEEFARTLS